MKTINAIQIPVILFLFIVGAVHGQNMISKGADLYISNGTSLAILGNFINMEDGSIDNSGNIFITGDWTNNATSGNLLQGTTGAVKFNGPSTQNIDGSNQTYFNDLQLETNVALGVETSVSTVLNLINASMDISGSDLTIESGGTISGTGAGAYIVTEGTGKLIQEVGDTDVIFPVGTSSSYVPVALNNSGTTDKFKVNVFEDVLDGGLTGSTIPEIDNCVEMTWDIEEDIPGGSDLTVTVQWNASNEGISFDRSECAIGHYINGEWDPGIKNATSGSGPYTVSRFGITSLSAFAVGDLNSPMVISLTLDLTAFLEGPYTGPTMETTLNTSGVIPLSQPFNTSPWNYPGTESVGSIPNTDVVDWVLVDLRDATDALSATGATTFDQQAGFVLKDGTIVGTDGSSEMRFQNSFSQNLFAVVWHRNHLGVMSAYPLSGSGGTYAYDFSIGSGQAYGGNNGYKEVSSGIWGMVAGDGNADGQVNNGDKNDVWAVHAGTQGYKSGDFNLDVQVNNIDKNDMWKPNSGLGGQVPDNIPLGGYICQVPE